MSKPPSATDDHDTALWDYVSQAAFALPAEPARQAAQKGLVNFLRELRRDDEEAEATGEQAVELRALQRWQTQRVAPQIAWSAAAEALGERLAAWVSGNEQEQQVIFLLEPPHGGHAAALAAWANQQGYPTVSPPSAEQILSNNASWLDGLPGPDALWVLPALEKTFLRHVDGLSLIRRFLDEAFSGVHGRGVIGCDSWAWAFLHHVWHGRRPVTITSQAFDKERLAQLFQELAQSRRQEPLQFRQADNGRHIWAPPERAAEGAAPQSDYLQQLAVFSRGIPGVALAVWRESLRIEPDENVDEESAAEERLLGHRTIWVAPWTEVKLPELPAGAADPAAFVLQTLLLHGGLSSSLLRRLLPLADSQTMETLHQLEEDDLVRHEGDDWQVTAAGYPVARQFLQTHGYLIDAF